MAKAIQTRIDAPDSLKQAERLALYKWEKYYTIVHGPTAYWQPNLFSGQNDAIVLASVKSKRHKEKEAEV